MNPPVSLELLHLNPGDVIVMCVDWNIETRPTIDELQGIFCSLASTFPRNQIICVPDSVSLAMASKDTLIDIRNAVNQILKSIEKREANE